MTRFSRPVAMQTVVSSFYNQAKFSAASKPQSSFLRVTLGRVDWNEILNLFREDSVAAAMKEWRRRFWQRRRHNQIPEN